MDELLTPKAGNEVRSMKINGINYRDECNGPKFRLEIRASQCDPTIKDAIDLLQIERVGVSFVANWRKVNGDEYSHWPHIDPVQVSVTEQMKEAVKLGDEELFESLFLASVGEQLGSEHDV